MRVAMGVAVGERMKDRESLSLSRSFTPRRHLRPSSGENIRLYNLFSPMMMIT